MAIVQFDELVTESFQIVVPGVADYELAKGYVQHFASKLRAMRCIWPLPITTAQRHFILWTKVYCMQPRLWRYAQSAG